MADSPERDVLRDAVNEGWHGMDDSWHDYDEIFAALAARGWRLVPSQPSAEPDGETEPCPTCWQPVPVPQRGDHDYGIPLRAAQPSAEPPLDVERLAQALHDRSQGARCQAFGARDHEWSDHLAGARAVARKYAALASELDQPHAGHEFYTKGCPECEDIRSEYPP